MPHSSIAGYSQGHTRGLMEFLTPGSTHHGYGGSRGILYSRGGAITPLAMPFTPNTAGIALTYIITYSTCTV